MSNCCLDFVSKKGEWYDVVFFNSSVNWMVRKFSQFDLDKVMCMKRRQKLSRGAYGLS